MTNAIACITVALVLAVTAAFIGFKNGEKARDKHVKQLGMLVVVQDPDDKQVYMQAVLSDATSLETLQTGDTVTFVVKR